MKRCLFILLFLLISCAPPASERPSPTPPRPSPTPTRVQPTPTPTPNPEVDSGDYSDASLSLEEEGPETDLFTTRAEGIFLNFKTEGVEPGVMLRSQWRFLGKDSDFSASEGQPASTSGRGAFLLDPPEGGWPVGDYQVALFVGKRQVRRLKFSIEQPQATPTPQATPDQVEAKTFKELARRLVEGKTTERDKAEALYNWLAQNISYDTQAYFSGDYGDCSPEAVFKSRTGVCSGYANLFKAMADEVNLESEVVDGFSKGYSFEPDRPLTQSDHAWNAVKIEGRWYLLDSTWGAGYIDERKRFVRRVTSFWFLTAPEKFIYSHLPEQERWQLLKDPVSREKYRRLPRVKPDYFEYGLKTELMEGSFKCEEEIEFSLQVEKSCRLGAGLEFEGERLENYTMVQQQGDRFTVRARFPKKGDYDLLIFVYPPGQNRGRSALVYQARCQTGKDAPYPLIYNDFLKHEVRLLKGDLGILSRGQNTRISLQAPSARRLLLVDGEKRLDMKSSGDRFELDFVPESDSITIYGGYEDDGRSVGLLKYEVEGSGS